MGDEVAPGGLVRRSPSGSQAGIDPVAAARVIARVREVTTSSGSSETSGRMVGWNAASGGSQPVPSTTYLSGASADATSNATRGAESAVRRKTRIPISPAPTTWTSEKLDRNPRS